MIHLGRPRYFFRTVLRRPDQPFSSIYYARPQVSRRLSTTAHDDLEHDDVEDVDPDFYHIILPSDSPFDSGVSHIGPPRHIPEHIAVPHYVLNPLTESGGPNLGKNVGKIKLGGKEESSVREAAKLAAKVKDFAGTLVKEGITTNAIDKAVHALIVSNNAYPSPLGYKGFPRSCCTSINNIVVHGIPDDRPLEDGDIVNIDITVFLNGYHGDTSQTFLVGNVSERAKDLIKVTNLALEEGIRACGPGRPFKGIGKAISEFLNRQHLDYCVSPDFTGHGIGKEFHTAPWIMDHRNAEPGIMEPGHCFTIEPAVIVGRKPQTVIFLDGWTTSTKNCARSAQAEHMVLITENGAEVLTRS